ncbi:hypothetical protein EHP00_1931 [Ecytonucleospora hepatopenaei]|uniref:Uncharacterized protein n=1 Tax=Ecytonucleospora hepatopenaei TaxID=646526 RepID=A0A1W0E3Q0_9MICR|nr:hypothetical protein EHP00_1931 [Ecytonucleospora hepatopenaei]
MLKNVVVNVHGVDYVVDLFVVKGLCVDAILGYDFIKTNNLLIDANCKSVIVNKNPDKGMLKRENFKNDLKFNVSIVDKKTENEIVHKIYTGDAKPIFINQYRLGNEKEKIIDL